MQRTRMPLALVVVATAATVVWAQPGKKNGKGKSSGTAVTVTFGNLVDDSIQSDGEPYAGEINSTGQLVVRVEDPDRTMTLVGISSSQVFWLVAPVGACQGCKEGEGEACENLPDGFRAIGAGDSVKARLVSNFVDDGGTEYRLRMGATITEDGTVDETVCGTDFVTVACGDANCTSWNITSGADDVGRLFEHVPRQKNIPADDVFLGNFDMPWSAAAVSN